jgi:SAM-dependent methyltransferase
VSEGFTTHSADRAESTTRFFDRTDSTTRFSDRVGAYLAARPRYPDAIAPLLARELNLPVDAVIADIGSGTGISCTPFLAAGFTLLGVEPNEAMRVAAERELAPQARFRSVKGTAEATTLAAASIDLAIAGQAFHWFDPERFKAEVIRILKPGGALALFWNSRVNDASPFMAEYDRLLIECCPEYREKWAKSYVDGTLTRHAPAMRIAFGGDWREAALDNAQVLDRAGLIARVESDSYAPKPGAPLHAPMVNALNALFDRHAQCGSVTIIYRTRIFFGRPR